MGKFVDYAVATGMIMWDAAKEDVRKNIDDIENRAANDADERGKSILVDALLDVNQGDDTIIRLLQKYYGMSEQEAEQLFISERTINIPCQALETYLVRNEGYDREEARQYIISSGIINKLAETKGLWKKSTKDLYIESKKH